MFRSFTFPLTVTLKILDPPPMKVLFFFVHVINMLAKADVVQQIGLCCQNKLNTASVCLLSYAFTKHIISLSSVSEGVIL